LAWTVTFYFSDCFAARALHVVALMGDDAAFESDCARFGDYRSVRSGFVAVKDQVAFHKKYKVF